MGEGAGTRSCADQVGGGSADRPGETSPAPPQASGCVFRLSPRTALEVFDEGALLLAACGPSILPPRLVELNPTAGFVLASTDGRKAPATIAAALASRFQVSEAEALDDTLSLYAELERVHLVEEVRAEPGTNENGGGEGKLSMTGHYTRNPEVVLREEDADGCLLFDPDSGQVRVLNATGLFLWKQLDGSQSLSEVCANLQAACQGADPQEVTRDVQDFVDGMVESGFLGILAPSCEGA